MASSPERPPLVDPDTGGKPVVEELLSRIADRSAKIAFLQEMTGALANAESLGELLDRTAEIAQRHLPYDVCSTHLVDPESGRITVVLGSGPLFETLTRKSLRVGEGIVGWVVENGRLANVGDVTRDPRWVRSGTQIRSELAVPIRSRGRVVGVFNLESAQLDAFKPYDEQIFSILAAQMGSALERVDLYREAVERARRFAALNQIARAIAAPLKLEKIFEVVADELMRLVPNDRVTLSLFDAASGEMRIVGVRGPSGEAGAGATYAPNKLLMTSEHPLLLPIERADGSLRDALREQGLEHFVAVPIRLEGEFVGQMNLAWKGDVRLPEGGLDFLSALGSHLAVVLKNARLYEQLTASGEELSRTQDRLIQSAKLAAVGELAAGVAHEINNPLTGILGYTQWVLLEMGRFDGKGVTPESAEAVRIRLEKIEREVLRCSGIVQNLLNFSRAHDRAVTTPIGLDEVVEATLGVTEHQLGMHKVVVVKRLGRDLPRVEGNANQLQQVFTNIVINAAKAMNGGGTLTVTTSFDESTSRVRAAFSDTGVGMSKQVRERIFEPFFTTRPVGEGTGLGLSVSYGIVQSHGGEIVVESEEGRGSTFIVVLPARS